MDNNAVCHFCGRTMNVSFRYCPYCGTAAEELISLALQIDEIFGSTGADTTGSDGSRISRMSETLCAMEIELSTLLSERPPVMTGQTT